jgi:hypothetical protein
MHHPHSIQSQTQMTQTAATVEKTPASGSSLSQSTAEKDEEELARRESMATDVPVVLSNTQHPPPSEDSQGFDPMQIDDEDEGIRRSQTSVIAFV